MNKLVRKFLCGALSIGVLLSGATATAATADADSLCRPSGSAILFFNGVQTTPETAEVALRELQASYGNTTPTGDSIRYDLFYNHSNGLEDFVETFEQRLSEQGGVLQGRFELFFSSLKGDGPWWSAITGAVGSTAGILTGIVDLANAAAARGLTALIANPPTQLVYQEHRSRLDNLMLEGKKLVLLAHSQGNLFVNPAYDYAASKVTTASVKVVHVAPASPRLSGDHTLADKDLVINGLRLVGTVANNTDTIPSYLERPAGRNGLRDVMGHGFIEIYLNAALTTFGHIKSQLDAALTQVVAPTRAAQSGFFTATLTWDGAGDIDLHTYEPSGRHVYYASSAGMSGFLDVDNTVANGPEHYYASCDAATLQTGVYKVAVANYSGGQGRKATLQIASSLGGVLETKTVVMGSATRDTPSVNLFDVVVARDAATGAYSVTLGSQPASTGSGM